MKGPLGPLPEGFDALLRTMDEADELKLQQRLRYGSLQKRPVALVIPDLSRFSGAEVATVESATERAREGNGVKGRDWSQGFIDWEIANDGEKIPYSAARLGFRDGRAERASLQAGSGGCGENRGASRESKVTV